MNNDSNNLEKALTLEQAKAWIFTLTLGLIVCLGLAIYTLVTHNLLFDYPDPTLFKPKLTWLGFIGICLYFSTFIVFWISSTVVKYLPERIQITSAINTVGITLLILFLVILFYSYNLQTKRLYCIGLTCQTIGLNMTITKDVIEYKFGKIARSWNLFGVILLFTGIMCFAFSMDT